MLMPAAAPIHLNQQIEGFTGRQPPRTKARLAYHLINPEQWPKASLFTHVLHDDTAAAACSQVHQFCRMSSSGRRGHLDSSAFDVRHPA